MVPPPLANQGQAAAAIGNVHEDQQGVDNIDQPIRGENLPLLDLASDIPQYAKYLNVEKGKKKNSLP